MGHMEPRNNPMAHFPKIRAERRKLPNALTTDEVQHLIARPRTDTVLGLRDRAMLVLLYGTGIRASECATLVEKNVDLGEQTIRVTGKGGHERVIPLNDEVVRTLRDYQMVRGTLGAKTFFPKPQRRSTIERDCV